MAKTKEEKVVDVNIEDMNIPMVEVTPEREVIPEAPVQARPQRETETVVSCLRNERIIVRHVPKDNGMITNPKHVLAGGMAETAVRIFTVPRLSSGLYVNPLTDNEKAYLEEIMGLEYNALSIYKKKDNYWDNYQVRLTKADNYLDLSSPDDYIKYKILLANKNFIADSIQTLQDKPKATYQYVIISEGEESRTAKTNMSTTMKCYKEFGKIENEVDVLRTIIETIDGRPTAPTEKLEFLHSKINTLIQADSKLFLKVITDPLLSTKVLIKKGVENGVISKRANFYYMKADNSPLCGNNEEPTLSVAAKFLNLPKNQELKLSIEAKLK